MQQCFLSSWISLKVEMSCSILFLEHVVKCCCSETSTCLEVWNYKCNHSKSRASLPAAHMKLSHPSPTSHVISPLIQTFLLVQPDFLLSYEVARLTAHSLYFPFIILLLSLYSTFPSLWFVHLIDAAHVQP